MLLRVMLENKSGCFFLNTVYSPSKYEIWLTTVDCCSSISPTRMSLCPVADFKITEYGAAALTIFFLFSLTPLPAPYPSATIQLGVLVALQVRLVGPGGARPLGILAVQTIVQSHITGCSVELCSRNVTVSESALGPTILSHQYCTFCARRRRTCI